MQVSDHVHAATRVGLAAVFRSAGFQGTVGLVGT